MEVLVLSTLEWRMGAVMPFHYLPCLSSRLRRFNGAGRGGGGGLIAVKAAALIFSAAEVASVLDYRPSTVAAVAVLAATHGVLTREPLESKISSLSPTCLQVLAPAALPPAERAAFDQIIDQIIVVAKEDGNGARRTSEGVASRMLHMALLLGIVFASILTRAASVGVCYGMSANNLPPASTVVGMLRDNGFNSVRLYAPDTEALAALAGTGIGVIVGAPNYVLPELAASASAAAAWVRANIAAHPDVSFRYITVGNEVAGSDTQYLVPAMENVLGALAAAGLGDAVKVTTAISQATIAVHVPPSAGEFAGESKPFLLPVLQFLERTGAPLLANLYPYFAYTYKAAGDMDVSFMLFTAPGTVVQDGEYGYQNMFDASVDAVHAAVERLGVSGVDVVVSETGWPSAGGEEASVDNARTYNQNLVSHVGKGTPRRPGKVETYVFSMFNENLKEAGVEQNWGLFYPTTDKVYPITFGR
ncbi:licheninase [Hordeum vulgare]|nr:licheninase [Hordeum vulgare]